MVEAVITCKLEAKIAISLRVWQDSPPTFVLRVKPAKGVSHVGNLLLGKECCAVDTLRF